MQPFRTKDSSRPNKIKAKGKKLGVEGQDMAGSEYKIRLYLSNAPHQLTIQPSGFLIHITFITTRVKTAPNTKDIVNKLYLFYGILVHMRQ